MITKNSSQLDTALNIFAMVVKNTIRKDELSSFVTSKLGRMTPLHSLNHMEINSDNIIKNRNIDDNLMFRSLKSLCMKGDVFEVSSQMIGMSLLGYGSGGKQS